jgi:hypothetical protein
MFNRKKTNKKSTVELLQEQSDFALNTFMQLINSLKDTNTAIDTQKKANAEAIKAIEAEQVALDGIAGKNNKVIDNFEALLK